MTMTNSEPTVVTGTATEPVLSRAAIVTVATAALGLGVAWGLPLTNTQQTAVLYAVGLLAPMVLAWWARRHVNSPATMSKVKAAASQHAR
jgi:hypothetical protein